jgi:hypothetical protein
LGVDRDRPAAVHQLEQLVLELTLFGAKV